MCQYALCVCVCERVCTTECEREANPDHDSTPSLNERHQVLPRQEPDENGRSPRSASDPGRPGPESNASPQGPYPSQSTKNW